MKAFILVLVTVIITTGFGFAQNPKKEKPAPTYSKKDKNKPEIVFEKLTHDFGNIPVGSDGACEFKFTNTGKLPLILSNVKSSCGCTIPSWTKEPILKKKNGAIKVKYDTKRIGSFQKTVTVYSNAKNSIIRLTIKGKIEKKNNNMPIKTKTLMSTD